MLLSMLLLRLETPSLREAQRRGNLITHPKTQTDCRAALAMTDRILSQLVIRHSQAVCLLNAHLSLLGDMQTCPRKINNSLNKQGN